MKLSTKGAAFIRGHEGFVARWYDDPVGVLTIGIGFTWKSQAFRDWWKKNKGLEARAQGVMTREEAEQALIFLCEREYGKAVNLFLAKGVPQHVYDGMVSPVYNLGPGSLKWKWAAACKAGHFSTAARLLTKTGTTAKGRKLPGLVRRRKEEALLIEQGIYTGVHGGKTRRTAGAMADGVLMRGERGPAVKNLIKNLKSMDYYEGRVDDLFGRGTESAVLAFQRANGLKADGYAGPETLKLIATQTARPAPVPVRSPVHTPKPVHRPEHPPAAPAKKVNIFVALFRAIFRR